MDFRKITAAAAAIVCAASVTACGKKEESSEAPVVVSITTGTAASTEASTEASTQAAASEADTTSAAQDETTEATSSTTTAAAEETTSSSVTAYEAEASTTTTAETTTQAAAISNEFEIADLGCDAAPYISGLGTPNDIEKADGCLANGADQVIYHYSGLDISCYVEGGKEYIYDITITSDKYSAAGSRITIGSTRSQVEAAYGKGEDIGGMVMYSAAGNTELDIAYDDNDNVRSISFFMSV